VLDVRPAEYFVRVIKREKRACKSCEEQGVQTAAALERILPKSVLSDNVIVDLIVSKYCDAKPLYRQQATMRRDAGIELALSTLDDAVMNAGELLIPIATAMKRELLAGTCIQADETPVGVQTHDKRGRNHQSYLWQYGSPGKNGVPADRFSSVGCGSVVFDFRMGRDREGPKLFLGNFEGLLQTDGYKVYDKVGGPRIVHAACLAHARRKHVDAVKVNAKDAESARVVALMDELFAIDRQAREKCGVPGDESLSLGCKCGVPGDESLSLGCKQMSHAERHSLRQERAPELLDKLRAQLLAIQKTALPRSVAGQAANYTLSLWGKLTLFLKHSELELSNNLAENSTRPVAIGCSLCLSF
jgi:transposase